MPIKSLDGQDLREGMVLRCDTLIWNEGWEFECPSLMLFPVIRCWERQMSHELMVENVMIRAIVDGKLRGEDFKETWGWRGYNLTTLRRRFREALAGKKFPIANYKAYRSYVKVIKEDGELTWVAVDPPAES